MGETMEAVFCASAARPKEGRVCAGTLRCNGKPIAAVAPKRRTVHYAEDIPAACRQIVSDFETEARKLEAKDSPQKNAAVAVEESPLEEGVRRIRESGIVIYPKNGNRG